MNELVLKSIVILFGTICLIVSQLTFYPQFFKLIKTRNTSGISLIAYCLQTISVLLWFIWSWSFYFQNINTPYISDNPAPLLMYQWSFMLSAISNTAGLVLMSSILVIKIRHVHLSKKLRVSELLLAKKILDWKDKKYKSNPKKLWLSKYWPIILMSLIDIAILLTVSLCLTFLTHPTTSSQPIGNWFWVFVINLVTAIFSESLSWPQFIKSIKCKDTTGISLFWAACIPLSSVLFFSYTLGMGFTNPNGFDLKIIPALVFNGFIPSFGVLILKAKNVANAMHLNMTERDYTIKYLMPKKTHKQDHT